MALESVEVEEWMGRVECRINGVVLMDLEFLEYVENMGIMLQSRAGRLLVCEVMCSTFTPCGCGERLKRAEMLREAPLRLSLCSRCLFAVVE